MQRLHRGLCDHFNQDHGLPITLFIHGHNDTLKITSSGDLVHSHFGFTYPKDMKKVLLDNDLATTEDLIKWLETHSSILVRINHEKQVFNQ